MTRDEIRPVALRDVQVADGFFSRYADLVREEVIPYQWEALNDRIPGAEKSGCLRNFRASPPDGGGRVHGHGLPGQRHRQVAGGRGLQP